MEKFANVRGQIGSLYTISAGVDWRSLLMADRIFMRTISSISVFDDR